VAHHLDAEANPWDTDRIALAEAVTWKVAPLSLHRPRDLRRLWKRHIHQAQGQQARGRLKDVAPQECIYSDSFTDLPSFADRMVAK
jgi:hypothetical protein